MSPLKMIRERKIYVEHGTVQKRLQGYHPNQVTHQVGPEKRIVQPWTADILALNWSAQSQDFVLGRHPQVIKGKNLKNHRKLNIK